jgi:6-phosphogluconolactonase
MTSPSDARLEILANPEVLARPVADWLLASATAKDGVFAVALSGGSTPRRLYECLAGPPYRDGFPWSRAHWFWGDERFVPNDDALSNYRMVRKALLSHTPIPAINIRPIPTEGVSPEAAAFAYECELKSFHGAERLDAARPLFDVNLLGLGSDGHTASLFPGTAVLPERDQWVAAVVGAKSEARITLTYPPLESSRRAAFLVVEKKRGRSSTDFAVATTACQHPIFVRPARCGSLAMWRQRRSSRDDAFAVEAGQAEAHRRRTGHRGG